MRRFFSRLAARIYLAGLIQIAVVLGGFVLLGRVQAAAEKQREADARAAVAAVAAKVGDEAALARELARVERELGASVTILGPGGRVIATNRREGDPPPRPPPFPPGPPPPFDHRGPPMDDRGPPFDHRGPPFDDRGPPFDHRGPPPPPPPPLGDGPGPPLPAYDMPVRLADGTTARAILALRGPPSPGAGAIAIAILVLGAVGVISLLLARSLARPLGKLSRAARDFGAGKLEARSGLARADEIGDVATAFDEMAERITSLLRAEKELLANVSHELRTPLARIRVALDIAEEGDAVTAREAITDIAQDLAELERLIGDVLTAARLDLAEGPGGTGIPPLRREEIATADLVEQAASRFRAAHPARPLVVQASEDLPLMDGDPVLLRRVIDNLLENAHKYSRDAAAEIAIEACDHEGAIEIEVRDHGIGISAEDLPHVFRPFFRADRSRTRATGGLGLGLALAKRIVEAHAGTITLTSALDEGTRALVRLPALRANNR